MLLFLICVLTGAAIGILAVAVTWIARRGDKGAKHEFRSSSMPDLDIDEELLDSGRRDESAKTFK